MVALTLAAVAMLVAIALVTYDPADPPGGRVWPPVEQVHNGCGAAGAWVAHSLIEMLGLGAYYAAGTLGVVAGLLVGKREIDQPVLRSLGWALSLVGISTASAIVFQGWSPGPLVGAGGYVGAMVQTWLSANFATAGSLLIAAVMLVSGLILASDYVVFRAAAQTASVSGTALVAAGKLTQAVTEKLGVKRLAGLRTDLDGVAGEEAADGADAEEEWDEEVEDEVEEGDEAESDEDEWEYEDEEEDEAEDEGPAISTPATKLAGAAAAVGGMIAGALRGKAGADEEDAASGEAAAVGDDAAHVEAPPEKEKVAVRKPKAKSEREEILESLDKADLRTEYASDYELPPIDLLLPPEEISYDQHEKEVRRKAKILEKTFQSFNLNVKVVEVETGPVISQYEVELEPGLRLSKITGLSDDLAIALRAPSVRIVAPIPGKNTVGIEAPNDTRQVVRLREVIEETDGQARRMKIPIFLGKDVAGNPMVVDLAALPHLLIAGRTGTGKSVCLNSIITSILMTRGPDEVRMLMIDPKMVELSGYRKLPHLMHPVVTDMKKAEAILGWAVDKMEERYSLLARAGVRHISTYNQLTEEELRERLAMADGQPMDDAEWSLVPKQLPFIVIVADEIADLMMTVGKDVETHIIRLAQKSRAVGIHLILATQKPTVDVITGLIKSNLPARIAFQVASRTDSRVVLDEMGADKLLGNGDMLFLSPGTSMLLRGQGTYVSDDEITGVVDFVGVGADDQRFASELMQLKTKEEQEAIEASTPPALKNRDDLYEAAVDVVVREGRGSVSLLQRCLGIGYGRAARLIDFMAEDGIVGEYNGSQAREVVISMEEWEAMTAGGSDDAPAAPVIKAAPSAAAPADAAPWEDEDAEAEEEVEEEAADDHEEDAEESEDDEASDEEDEWEYEEVDEEEPEEEAEGEEDESDEEEGDDEWEYEYEEEDAEEEDAEEEDTEEGEEAEGEEDEADEEEGDDEWEYEEDEDEEPPSDRLADSA